MKIIYTTPHLSSGGMPEYLRRKIELLKDTNDIWVIELHTEFAYRIIRDKIEKMLGSRLIPVNSNFERMYEIIQQISPDIIHFEELSDYHIPESILDKIYIPERTYKIFETFHDSSIESFEKKFLPDKMLVVSPWQLKMMKELGVPIEVINHEIESGIRNRESLLKLELDPNKKHVIQVGLFSSRKNQSETFEMARLMPDIQFHFLGGLTDNYKYYWENIVKNKPDNCKIWGERNDIYSFYECVDAVIFPSRGNYGDRETNPLVIRESIAWNTPILVRDLPVYMGMYKESDNVKFMSDNINENVKFLYKILNKEMEEIKLPKQEFTYNYNFEKKPEIIKINQIDSSFFKKKLFNINFDSNDNKINFEYLETLELSTMVCVRDIDSEVPIYSFDAIFVGGSNYWCIPIPKGHYDFKDNPNFGGFLYDFYVDGKKIYSMASRIKRASIQKNKFRVESFDPLFVNFEQFFTDKIYENFFNEIPNLSLVVDVGANVGLFTQLCLSKGAERVISLEINKKAIETFEQVHGNNDKVRLIKLGLSKEIGEIDIFLDPNNSLVSSVFSNHTSNLNQVQKVKVIGLDDLILQEKIEKIDLIKIDVEGSEYEIFNGISEESLKKINYILMEFHDNFGNILRDSILDKLENSGFTYEIYQDDCIGIGNEYEERGTIFAKRN